MLKKKNQDVNAYLNFWPLLKTLEDLAKLSLNSSTTTSANSRAKVDSFMWNTQSPQLPSGLQVSSFYM